MFVKFSILVTGALAANDEGLANLTVGSVVKIFFERDFKAQLRFCVFDHAEYKNLC